MDYLLNLRPAQARLISAVAAHGQLQVAAAACQMTQPAASRMLADMERNLRAKLFIRTPKGMELTPAGRVLVRHAERIANDLSQMAQEFDSLRGGQGGTIRVGAVTGPALGQLVPAIQRLKSDAPGVEISVEVAPSVQLMQALERGDLDFVLGRVPPSADWRDFEIEIAQDEVVRLLVRDGHPLLDRPVGMAALKDLPWILQDRGTPIRAAIETAFAEEGLPSPQDVITTSSLLVIVALVSQSDAVAPISQEVVDMMLEPPVSANFKKLPLTRPVTVEPYQIVVKRHRTLPAAALTLLDLVRERILGPSWRKARR
ncbi:LysR family transcriptional regulator [Donghicola sp. C2-DW-16]|uniref:LysR family transcriptional regulator n=1 Tax=Donghicola mangrovi TaxID=2729614 RepID=A0ABX2PK81_9RHOB|nr:LysR family transcriptional regulator [Donghicola mangrovi]NVO29286.1 LysR family transcriptional regulator [Donghicola mangrovi]